jgi:hypothetical protein
MDGRHQRADRASGNTWNIVATSAKDERDRNGVANCGDYAADSSLRRPLAIRERLRVRHLDACQRSP